MDVRPLVLSPGEVQAVLPELVVEIDGDLTVDYGLLAALLIEAVKDLKAQIDANKVNQ